jgi:emfourin
MRLNLRLLILIALLLSACASASDNTAVTGAPQPPTAEATSDVQLTPVIPIDVTVPPVGTMIAPVTEDPDAGTMFDAVYLEQSGGFTGMPLKVEVHSDGRLVRDGVVGSVTPEQVAEIDNIIREINFFGLQGQFEPASTNPDAYSYKISVDRGGSSRTINAQDGYTPEPLLKLINAVSLLGA